MKFNDKSKIIIGGSILVIVIIFTFMLFPNHYATDTYNIIELGFKGYAEKWFAPSGRTVGMLVLLVFEKLAVSCDTYILCMKIISVIIATITIYIFYELLLKNSKDDNKYKKITFFIATLLIFLNNATYQYFYYPESAVMWLGILCVVIAIKINLNKGDKLRYIKSSILIFLAMNCYQAIILFYLPAKIILSGQENKSLKEFFIDIIKNGIILCINMILGYFIIEKLREKFDVIGYKYNGIILNKNIIMDNIQKILLEFNDAFPNSIILTFNTCIISFCTMLPKDMFRIDKKKSMLVFLLMLLISFIEIVLIISLTDFYIADRIQFAYVSTIGLTIIFLLYYTNIIDIKIINKCIVGICAIMLVFNIVNSFSISIWSRIARERDVKIGNTISRMIYEYEKSNQKITKVEYCYDSCDSKFDYDIRKTGEPTQRIMWANWVIDNAIRYFSNNSELIINENPKIYEEIFDKKDWNVFSEEQIKFINDVMYFCIY